MELRQLKYFLKAADLLNFTQAAREVFISQSTLSQQIRQLEDELGLPMFNRIGKRVELTEAGRLFYPHARSAFARANDGKSVMLDLQQLNTGQLNIGVTYGLKYILTPALIHFAEKYPKIKINVYFATSEELVDKLNHSGLDFVLSFEEVYHDQSLQLQSLFESKMCLIASSGSALCRKKTVSLSDIQTLPMVLPATGYSTRRFIDSIFKKSDCSPEVAIEINDIPTLLELVRTGQWYTILAETTLNINDNLVSIPITGSNMIRKAVIISLKEAYEKKSATEFFRILLGQN
ncbi:LysR substrate-binding domain-containing protein [Pedobacter jeongneungensis]|uniref:LysR substrate-binding domain-containing protein n=1 Tax=Pedobacter jeongneungensis TaxID=947309 RepID=UPI00046AF4B9|nr:LysR substrate-binding domain-containing protein [Pedobacter jeongneungensis]